MSDLRSNSLKYPKWAAALRKRLTEIYSNKDTFCELMDLVWDEPLIGSVYEDTNVSTFKKDSISIDNVLMFVMEHNIHSMWSGNQEEALKSFIKLRDYIGVSEQKE